MQTKYIFLLILITISSCKNVTIVNQPRNLEEAIIYFNQTWSETQKETFLKTPEDKAVSNLHLTVGMWIRNTWIRNKEDTVLASYFHELGIFHPDDISSIILTSLHRSLNGKKLQLELQVASVKAYWKPIIDCESIRRNEAIIAYNNYKIGDPISIRMNVDTSADERNAIIFTCPNVEWSFDPRKDLELFGIVKDKYFINDSSNVFFKVLIKKMNFKNTLILGQSANIGDIIDFSLRGLILKN